jgi:Domain of unknown function (DUF4145)
VTNNLPEQPAEDPWNSTPRELQVGCPNCKKIVIAYERGAVQVPDPDWGDYGPEVRYSLMQCFRCNQPMFVEQGHFDEDITEPVRLWPSPPRTLSEKIPDPLREEMTEARACYDAKAYTATVVMVRRTLEGVCAEHKITKHPLNKALAEMTAQGLIDGRLSKWADGLRVIGNEGAHYTGTRVSPEDARDALALAEAMLDYMYVLTAQFDEFQARRKKSAPQSAHDDSE